MAYCSTHRRDVKFIPYAILIENPERKKPLGRSKLRRHDNIRKDLRKI
jgi:hypothetical protein